MWARQDNLVPMEADLGVNLDFFWPTPHFFEPHDHELAAVDSLIDCCSSMYVPNEDSLSGLYSCYGDSSSPDGANSCLASTTAMAATETAKAASKNIVMERDRRRRLNEKLFTLRGVVPNITKMDKASIIRDAIAYTEQLQEQERQLLEEISALESATAVVKMESVVSVGGAEEDSVAFPQRKKTRTAPSISSIDDAALCSAASPPVKILEVQVTEVGEKVVVVNVRYGKARDAMSKVCRTLESVRLKVATASVTAVAGSIIHTMFVETEGTSGAQVEEAVRAALAQLDVTTTSLKSTS